MKPVKIIMGLHPHPGWRSFKTGQTFLRSNGTLRIRSRLDSERFDRRKLSEAGQKMYDLLWGLPTATSPRSLRFKSEQVEVFSHDWGKTLEDILSAISRAAGGDGSYELEVRSMQFEGNIARPSFYDELREIEGF